MANPIRLILMSAIAAAFLVACSPKTEDQAKAVSHEIKDKAREIAEDTKDKTSEIAGDVADKGKQVLSATGEAISDGWITAKIKVKFADEKLLKENTITVETDNRVVTLKGTVVSAAAKARATSIAGGTEGVGRVVDELVVKAR